jgi:hypothetical protein
MKDNFIFTQANPQQVGHYYDNALEVEGVPAKIPDNVDMSNAILKVAAYQTAEDLMRYDKKNTNVNEFHMGIMGEFALDDLQKVKESINKLLFGS